MDAFSLALSNGHTVSGLACIPPTTPATPSRKPLIVALHGGTMTSAYFNATSDTSAAGAAVALGLPFVAIDRPGYAESTPILPQQPQDDDTYFQVEGRYLHEHILPAIWEQYAKPTKATCIVLLGHSMGCASTIVAAGLAALEPTHSYVLGGIIITGWGTAPSAPPEHGQAMLAGKTWTDRIAFPDMSIFGVALYGPKEQGLVPEAVRGHTSLGVAGCSYGEAADGILEWPKYWRPKYASKIAVPVFHAMGGADGLWNVNEQVMRDFTSAFERAKRVESRIFEGAPHCLEVSSWSRVWYLRCFAFASECAMEV
jgi:pimeloyl-ACP methyl ester carboxylesterase